MEPGKGIFDRIEQTFFVMKNNVFSLILPIFIFHIFYFAIVWEIYFYYMIQKFSFVFSQENLSVMDIIYSPKGIYFIAIAIALVMIYLFLYIPFLLASIRGVDQAVNEKKVTIIDNIFWGCKHLFESFATYWYIFAYIYLFPALIFIFGGVLFNINSFFLSDWIYSEIINKISIAALMLGFFISIVSAVYRGFKTSFSLYNAVSKESFTKKNFLESIYITKNNWWRIFGNFILFGMIFGFLKNIVGGFLNLFIPSAFQIDMSSLNTEGSLFGALSTASQGNIGGLPNNFDISQTDMMSIFQNTVESYSYINAIIGKIAGEFVDTIFLLAGFIFTYIFMKRLEYEYNQTREGNQQEL